MAETIKPDWAWQAFEPSDKTPWDIRKVGHLYRRAAFGATLEELHAGVKSDPATLVDALLKGGKDQETFDGDTNREAQSISKFNSDNLLAPWWLYRMLY